MFGVHGQIHKDLFDLSNICIHPLEPGGQICFDRDHFREGALQQAGDFPNRLVQLGRNRRTLHIPADRHQLLRNLFAPGRRLIDPLQVFEEAVLRVRLFQAHLGIADDNLKQVIKVVRQSAGKRADGIHFLCAAQLAIQLFALRDVFCQADRLNRVFPGIKYGNHRNQKRSVKAGL